MSDMRALRHELFDRHRHARSMRLTVILNSIRHDIYKRMGDYEAGLSQIYDRVAGPEQARMRGLPPR